MINREKTILRYINDDLTNEELKKFESQMDVNPALAKEVEEMLERHSKQSKKSVRKKDALELAHEELILSFGKHDMGSKESWRKISFWFLLVMTLLILLGYFLKE